jgi:hypothetical protein
MVRSAGHLLLGAIVGLGAFGCAGSKLKVKTGADRAKGLGPDTKGSGGERCDASKQGREVSQYDTSGDGRPDVRKVFLAIGAGVDARLVMICRETDVNGDGKKDVIRYYDDDGRSLREEADRNFDGHMDQVQVFQNGNVVREEFDTNYDGKIDTKIFYDAGKPLRAERDLKGRSTETQWRPDRWEYYEDGRMVRMGTDLDGDGRVDRWDRDLEWKSVKDKQVEAEASAEGATPTEAAAADSKAPEAGATPASATADAKPAAATTATAKKTAAKTKSSTTGKAKSGP